MFKISKRLIWLAASCLLILGLALSGAGTALAALNLEEEPPVDTTFTLLGALTSKAMVGGDETHQTWTVNGQAFVVTFAPAVPPAEGTEADVTDPTVCTDTAAVVIDCNLVTDGDIISVAGEKVPGTPEIWYAASINVVLEKTEGSEVYPPYTGVLNSITENEDGTETWSVGALTFLVDGTTTLPVYYAPSDTVMVTFTVMLSGAFHAESVVVVTQGNPYTYTGILNLITDNGDGTFTWLVDDKSFLVDSATVLPPYFGVGDEVTVEFIVEGEVLRAVSITVVTTFVPQKSETERCTMRLKEHPALAKLAQELGLADSLHVTEMFCLGFGVGEIKLAYKHHLGSEYTPEMLLAMRARGMGWGEIKKLAEGKPADDDSEDVDPVDVKVTGKPEKTEKPEKPETPGKPDNPGNSDKDKDNPGKAKGKNK